jgi:hypothetical protein
LPTQVNIGRPLAAVMVTACRAGAFAAAFTFVGFAFGLFADLRAGLAVLRIAAGMARRIAIQEATSSTRAE